MRQTIIAGNWKMNGTIVETESLLGGILDKYKQKANVQVIVAPPYVSLWTAAGLLDGSPVALSGQDMSQHSKGAFTGDISAEMLLTVGATHVILGHSERRQYHAEDDSLVNAKAKQALSSGLTPIICVGETLQEREAGQTEAVVGRQLDGALDGLTDADLRSLVLAYEPVWAIGTGKTATPEMAEEVHKFIRDKLSAREKEAAEVVSILYGGSVKPSNAKNLLAQPNIDGALVGGASLKAEDFLGIIAAA